MNVLEFNQKKKYSEASGVVALVDENITMMMNEWGMYEESVSLEDHEQLHQDVAYVAPYLNETVNESVIGQALYEDILGIKHHKRLGYYASLYAGHVAEGDFRAIASSGGMATWIFKELFEKDLIDGVIHVKKNSDEHSDILFKYDISRSTEEIKAGAKTKYYPLEMSEVLTLVKENPGRYAIIGVPAFIKAVRLLSHVEPLIKERIHFTLGLICGHQKSSKFAESLAWQVGLKPSDIKDIDFRKKLADRPALDYGIEFSAVVENKHINIIKPMSEMVVEDWGQGFFKQLASDFYDDVMNETADVTLGDAWLDQYADDWQGNSVVISRHPIIENIIKEGIALGKLNLDEISEEDMIRSQASHFRHTQDELAYRLYVKDSNKEWRPVCRTQASQDIPPLRQKVQDLRMKLATQSHILYKKAAEKHDFNFFVSEIGKISKQYQEIYRQIKQNRK